MPSSVPAVTFTSTGLVLPTEADILAGAQADLNSAFGGNLNPSLETPQGQIASSLTAIVGAANDTFADIVNQVDPAFADGRMQEAIARIYFLTRSPGSSTLVACTVNGSAGVTIPLGAKAQDTSGNVYVCVQAGTFSITGTMILNFQNITIGAIACPAGTLTRIYQAISGWDTITNVADGTIGSDVESRLAFEYRRQQSVALNSNGWAQAVNSAVFNVPGVLDVYVAENSSGTSQNVGATTYAMAAHSVYVAVVGGLDADVAQAIWRSRAPGADYNGNTTVSVPDTNYQLPYPTYSVKFQRPTALPIKFAVSIANDVTLPSTVVNDVKAAIIAAFNGTDGSQRARIGSTLLQSRYIQPIQLKIPNARILSVLLGPTTATLTNYTLGIDQQPTITGSNIAVTLV